MQSGKQGTGEKSSGRITRVSEKRSACCGARGLGEERVRSWLYYVHEAIPACLLKRQHSDLGGVLSAKPRGEGISFTAPVPKTFAFACLWNNRKIDKPLI